MISFFSFSVPLHINIVNTAMARCWLGVKYYSKDPGGGGQIWLLSELRKSSFELELKTNADKSKRSPCLTNEVRS